MKKLSTVIALLLLCGTAGIANAKTCIIPVNSNTTINELYKLLEPENIVNCAVEGDVPPWRIQIFFDTTNYQQDKIFELTKPVYITDRVCAGTEAKCMIRSVELKNIKMVAGVSSPQAAYYAQSDQGRRIIIKKAAYYKYKDEVNPSYPAKGCMFIINGRLEMDGFILDGLSPNAASPSRGICGYSSTVGSGRAWVINSVIKNMTVGIEADGSTVMWSKFVSDNIGVLDHGNAPIAHTSSMHVEGNIFEDVPQAIIAGGEFVELDGKKLINRTYIRNNTMTFQGKPPAEGINPEAMATYPANTTWMLAYNDELPLSIGKDSVNVTATTKGWDISGSIDDATTTCTPEKNPNGSIKPPAYHINLFYSTDPYKPFAEFDVDYNPLKTKDMTLPVATMFKLSITPDNIQQGAVAPKGGDKVLMTVQSACHTSEYYGAYDLPLKIPVKPIASPQFPGKLPIKKPSYQKLPK